MINEHIEWMKDYGDGPGQFYKRVYKGTGCGPSIGFTFTHEIEEYSTGAGEMVPVEKTDTLYCDDLWRLGSWEDMEDSGMQIIGVSVGSIVEGVDYDCDTIHLEHDEDNTGLTSEKFWQAVQDVDDQANRIWKRTHGCEKCFELWMNAPNNGWGIPVDHDSYVDTDDYDDVAGMLQVHGDCKFCGGSGVPM